MKRSTAWWVRGLIVLAALVGVFQFTSVFGASDGIDLFQQCSNDDGDGYATGDQGCRWINGAINASNSAYHEGDATVQRLAIDNLPAGTDHTVTIKYGTTKGGKHAYDFLTDDNFSELAPNFLTAADLCDPAITNIPTCSTLPAVQSNLIPTDSNAGGFDVATSARHFSIRNGTWFSGGIQSGPTLVSGLYTGDSDTAIVLKFSVPNNCDGLHSGKCEVLITWGAHISTQANWGPGTSAISIPGSPYHVQIAAVDSDSITGGGRDNQMQASALIITPTVATELHKADHSVVAVGATVPLGTTMHDKVTVTGNTPTGNVTLQFFGDAACAGSVLATSGGIALAAGSVDATAFPQGPLAAGSYGFKAHYVGDVHNTAADGTCENFVVGKANTTTTTQVHNTSHVDKTNSSVPLGSVMHDSATVGGQVSGVTATGNVTYKFFTNGLCTAETEISTEPVAVGSESSASAALAAGSYSYLASYAGDVNYNSSNGTCEPFTVSQAQLTTATQVHDSAHTNVTGGSVPLGSVVHDTATLTGAVGGFATPDVTFTFYTSNNCTTGGSAVTNVGAEGGAVASAVSAALGVGSYSYKASVAANTNYLGDDSDCEPFTVSPAQLAVTTAVHDSAHADITGGSAALNSVVHDTAALTGGVDGFATPAVTFTLYNNGTCTGDGSPVANTGADEVTLTSVRSAASAALGAGDYSYKGSVAGSTNYLGDNSDCEKFTINQAQTGVTTVIHAGDDHITDVQGTTLALNSAVHDKATVTGQVGAFVPTGTLSYNFYHNGACSDSPFASQSGLALSAESNTYDNLVAGGYSFKASYSGDTNYAGSTGVCEVVTVGKADTTTVTEIHKDGDATHTAILAADLGDSVHDNAIVGDKVGDITIGGNVSYVFYTSGNCTSGGGTAFETAVGGESATSGALAAGDYSYKATYLGDTNYNGSTGVCEPLTINRVTPGMVTDIHKGDDHATAVTSVSLGSTVHDKATLSGLVTGFDPSANVSFTFYPTNDCTGQAGIAAGSVAVVSGIAHPSDSQGPLGAGSYSFKATYPGDNNYNSAEATCEPLTVNKATPAVATELHNSDESVIATEASTSTVHDKATVTGGVAGFVPGGNVEFTFYTNGTCANTGAAAGVVALNGVDPGTAHPSTSEGPLAAGSYSFKAHYVGDNNYLAGDAVCEPFTVTTLTINKLANGGNDTFGYTVAGPTNATPNVTTAGTPGTGATTIVVLAGQYTVGETTIPSGWKLVGLSCAGGQTVLGPTSPQFGIVAGTNAVCNFENTKQGMTRTQGFWSTHTDFANLVWNTLVPSSERDMSTWGPCTGIITATTGAGTNSLMGGFWANVANTTTGKRAAIDKTRMQMLQQLLAAMLNKWGLNAGDAGLVDQAQTAYCGSNQNAIQQKIGQLGTFNESGDSIPLGFNVPNATPKASKDQANIAFWNNPTTHP